MLSIVRSLSGRMDWFLHLQWAHGRADVDLARIDTRPVRLNVSRPSNLVQQIDTWASAHHMTCSGFLAKTALAAMRD